MSSLLTVVADALYKLNPSLCDVPPRGLQGEFCYLGNNGTENGAILCQDMAYEHVLSVGSWMLNPQRIATEGIIGICLCSLMSVWLVSKILTITPPMKTIHHPKGSSLLSLLCLGTILYYKSIGFENKIYYVFMPCNMQWVLSVVQCYLIPDSWVFLQFSILCPVEQPFWLKKVTNVTTLR